MGGARRRIPQDRARATTLPPPEGERIASAAAAIAGGRGCGGIGWRAGRSRFFAFSLLLFIFPLFFFLPPPPRLLRLAVGFRTSAILFGAWLLRSVVTSLGRAGATAMEAIRRLRFPFGSGYRFGFG